MNNADFDALRDQLRAEFQAAAGDAARQANIREVFEQLAPIQDAMNLQNLATRAAQLRALSDNLENAISRIRNQTDNFLLSKLISLKTEIDRISSFRSGGLHGDSTSDPD